MSEIITKMAAIPDTRRSVDVEDLMTKVLAPYALADQFWDARRAIREECGDFGLNPSGLFRWENGALIATTRQPTDPAQRWKVYCRAAGGLDWMPPVAQIAAASEAIKREIETKPPPKQRKLLIELLLSALGIRASDDTDGYISALSFMLTDVARDRFDKGWHIPLAALAHAIKHLWGTLGDNYGRLPPTSRAITTDGLRRPQWCWRVCRKPVVPVPGSE